MDLESEGGAADADALDGVGRVARADQDVSVGELGEEGVTERSPVSSMTKVSVGQNKQQSRLCCFFFLLFGHEVQSEKEGRKNENKKDFRCAEKRTLLSFLMDGLQTHHGLRSFKGD